MIGHLANTAVRYSGLTTLLRRLRIDAPILCYHNVVPDELLGSGDPGLHLPLDRFASQMEWLRRHYRVAPLEELLALPNGKSWRGAAAITFDDGYVGAFRHALPVLKALDLPATFFVLGNAPTTQAGFWWDDAEIVHQANPQRKARWLTTLAGDDARIRAEVGSTSNDRPTDLLPASWREIRSAAGYAGLSIGAHSVTHRALPALDPAALAADLVESRSTIARELNIAPNLFAYPYGLWSTAVHDVHESAVIFELGANRIFGGPWRSHAPTSATTAVQRGQAGADRRAGTRAREPSPAFSTLTVNWWTSWTRRTPRLETGSGCRRRCRASRG